MLRSFCEDHTRKSAASWRYYNHDHPARLHDTLLYAEVCGVRTTT